MKNLDILTDGAGIEEARPGDIYVSPSADVWQIMGTISEPAVIARRINIGEFGPQEVGGMSGFMWAGFKRIFRARI